MVLGKGNPQGFLTDGDVEAIVAEALSRERFDGRRVLVIIPDSTRTAPVPLFFRLICAHLLGRAKSLDFLIALGTHPPMSDEAIERHLGITRGQAQGEYADVGIHNHAWDRPDQLARIGTITEEEMDDLSGGLLHESVPVEVNKRVLECDRIIIVGPTFPHEVVGFSGGNKYFFPGVAGPAVLHSFHWLGAVITNPLINGTKKTPVRDVIDKAASFIDKPKTCFSLVVTHDGLKGVFVGTPEEAFDAAADLSAKVHIVYVDKPFKRVLSMAPEMYDDIWTAGKCMYKLEPVLADGAELVIYAPHIDEISYTHGAVLDRIGYHTRDYFLAQMDRFADVPKAVMAHSTHVKGIGKYEAGVEMPRVEVVLATRIPEERCRRVNLGYADPASIDPDGWKGREDEGILCVPRAGEMLYRLKDGTVPRIDEL